MATMTNDESREIDRQVLKIGQPSEAQDRTKVFVTKGKDDMGIQKDYVVRGYHYNDTGDEPGFSPVGNVTFQSGPLPEAGVNGVMLEDLIAICIDQLEQFQAGKFRCRENALAVTHLETAALWLYKRTAGRIVRGVEGTRKE